MTEQPYSPINNDATEALLQLEQTLYTDPGKATELVRKLDLIDYSALSKELQVRFQAGMGFHHNLSGQLILAEKCFGIALQLLTKTIPNFPWSRSVLFSHLAGVQMNLGRFPDAESNLNHAVAALRDQAPATDAALIHCRRAFIMVHYAWFDQAMSLFLQALDTIRHDSTATYALPEAYIASLAWSGLGEVYMRTGDHAKSKESFLKCLEICEKSGLKVRIGWHYLNAGTSYLNDQDTAEAKKYFQQALVMADHRNVHANANANLGIAHLREHQHVLAAHFFDAAEAAYGPPQRPEDFSNLSVLELNRAEVAFAQQDQILGLQRLEKAFVLGGRGDNRLHLINVAKRLAEYHSVHNQFRQAYEYLLQAEEISSKYTKILGEEKIRELQVKHEAIQKEKEAELAKSELSALQLRSLRAQFNPHFMFNALNGLANMISAKRNDDALDLLEEFSKLLRMSLDLSTEEWIPLDKELEFAMIYMLMQKRLKFMGNLITLIDIPEELAVNHFSIPSMVLQPFIENAVEHGLSPNDGGTIRIAFRIITPGVLTCTIEDDGIGLIEAKRRQQRNLHKHKSRGMQFTEDRLKMLHHMNNNKIEKAVELIDLSTIEGGKTGTRVVLEIPLGKKQKGK